MVQALLNAGADASLVTQQVQSESPAAITLLHQCIAVVIMSAEHTTALMQYYSAFTLLRLVDPSVLAQLLTNHCGMCMRDCVFAECLLKQGTALHAAAAAGHSAVVEVLLEAGADPSVPNGQGDTPLDVATDEATLLLLTQHIEAAR
jgi:Ankyrin repeats (many copies)